MNKTINDSKAAILEAHNAIYVIKIDNPVKQPSELAARECFIKLEHTCCEFGLHIRNVDWANKISKFPLIGGHEGIGGYWSTYWDCGQG